MFIYTHTFLPVHQHKELSSLLCGVSVLPDGPCEGVDMCDGEGVDMCDGEGVDMCDGKVIMSVHGCCKRYPNTSCLPS